jgi:hypothetical protein
MIDGFSSMDTAPRDGSFISGMSVAGNILDVKWMPSHPSTYHPATLIPAGWCDALTLEAIELMGWRRLMGWRPVDAVATEGEQDENAATDTVGKLMDILATLPREQRIVLASDQEGNAFHFLADTGEQHIWKRRGELEFVDDEDTELIEAGNPDVEKVVILWP